MPSSLASPTILRISPDLKNALFGASRWCPITADRDNIVGAFFTSLVN
jgi:hypothetical protein